MLDAQQQSQTVSRSPRSRWQNRLFFLVCATVIGSGVLFGLVARVTQLGAVPLGLYWDEVAMAADARMLLETGADLHGRPWRQALFVSYGDYKLPIYIWATTAMYAVVGDPNLAVRIPSLVAGITTMVMVSMIAWLLISLFGNSQLQKMKFAVALSGMLLLAVTPWAIHFSRVGFEAHFSQALTGLSVLILLYGWRRATKTSFRLLSTGFSTVIAVSAVYTYYATRFVIPVVLVWTLALLLYRSSQSAKHWLMQLGLFGIVCLSVFVIGLLPMVYSPHYTASNQFRLSTKSLLSTEPFVLQSNAWRELAGNTVLDRVAFHRRALQALAMLQHVALHLDPSFLFFSGDSNLRHSTSQHGILLLVAAPCLAVGLLWLLKQNPAILSLLIVWWLTALIPAAIPMEVPHALRSLNALLPISLLSGFGAAVIVTKLHQTQRPVIAATCIGVAGMVMLFEATRFVHTYTTWYPFASASSWQYGYHELAVATTEIAATHQVVVAVADERFPLWFMTLPQISASTISQAVAQQGPLPKSIGAISFRDLMPGDFQSAQPGQAFIGDSVKVKDLLRTTNSAAPPTIRTISLNHSPVEYTAVIYEAEP